VFEAANRDAWGGMQHTNLPPVIHRDLKSPNVLISATWEAKVCLACPTVSNLSVLCLNLLFDDTDGDWRCRSAT
jgi:hypothetical protein